MALAHREAASTAPSMAQVRSEFPILATKAHGRPLVYLDSAASTQKPRAVTEEIKRFYEQDYANIHRGVYELSERATAAHDTARRKVQRLIGAADWREIVFVRGTTEAINLVAYSFLEPQLGPGDEILVTEMEHHANIVPWQLVAERTGAKVVAAPINDEGELLLDAFAERITSRTKMIAVAWVSSVLGTVNPVAELTRLAHRHGVPILIDAAQAIQHLPVDVAEIGCDFLAFSGHKMYGPSGVGVLYGRAERLEAMRPWQGGGDMIERVSFAGNRYNEIPFRFEAGTPDLVGIPVLGTAVDWIQGVGIEAIAAHEEALLAYAMRAMRQVPTLSLVGTAREKCSILAFTLENVHPHDIGTLLDLDGVAIRTGLQCAHPLHERLGLVSTARASIGVYNDEDDIDALVQSLHRVVDKLG